MKNSETIGLTPAQRLHFDIYGFVLLENVLNDDEIERMKGALYRMKADEDLDNNYSYIIIILYNIYIIIIIITIIFLLRFIICMV